MAKLVTPHFSFDELACPCCNVMGIGWKMLQLLEALRSAYGKPMRVTSGYRCRLRNDAVGGVKNSQHTLGKAVDVECIGGKEKFKLVRLAYHLGFRGIGVYKTFIHLDIRDDQPVLWRG